MQEITMQMIDETVAFLRKHTNLKPEIGIILGSGLNRLAEEVQQPVVIEFKDIPNFPVSTVQGHSGRMVIGLLEGKDVLVMQGRVHYYEGYSMQQVVFPVRVMQRFGVKTMIVTNAAGGVNPNFTPGDLMLITDHLGLVTMGGENPLRGRNMDEFGPRFPDMSQAYDREYLGLARKVSQDLGIHLQEGVYAGLPGPSFETPADLRFLRLIGSDAVGMSTVPEVITARHGGIRVLGFSGISNKANLDGTTLTTHEEVLEAGNVITPKLIAVIKAILRELMQ